MASLSSVIILLYVGHYCLLLAVVRSVFCHDSGELANEADVGLMTQHERMISGIAICLKHINSLDSLPLDNAMVMQVLPEASVIF